MTSETPLSAVSGITASVLKQLRKRWIESADQLVALGATSDGVHALAQELEIDAAEVARLIAHARAALHPDAAAVAERPVDTRRYPLGATPPERKPGKDER
jgi:hypothetical protein